MALKAYSHFGDTGDLIAALATIATIGPGTLTLYPAPGRVREVFTPEKVERLRSFLECQEYVTGVSFAEHPVGTVLDKWRTRRPRGHRNLADAVADAFNVPHWSRELPWCKVDKPYRAAPVVLARSPRYHGHAFPWSEIVREYGTRAVFVGTEDEHEQFTAEFGYVPHHHTPTLLDLARVIAGASLFVGNQSTPAMLAEALKRPRWLEVGNPPNCHWNRAHSWYGHDFPTGANVVPKLSDLPALVTPRRDLSLIVVAWGRPELLAMTLDSIKNQCGGLSVWVVVADNESSTETRAVCEAAGVDYWPIPHNSGINWPIEHLLAPCLNSDFVCVSDADMFFGRPLKTYLDFLRHNPDVAFAKGAEGPEHEVCGEREYNGDVWLLKACERGGGVVMRTETLLQCFPLPNHLIDFDWHLCEVGGCWAVLPGAVAHLGQHDRTHGNGTPTLENFVYQDGAIVPVKA